MKKQVRIPMDPQVIAKAHRDLRELQDLSCVEVGRRAGLNRTAVSNREKVGFHWVEPMVRMFDAMGYKIEILISPK